MDTEFGQLNSSLESNQDYMLELFVKPSDYVLLIDYFNAKCKFGDVIQQYDYILLIKYDISKWKVDSFQFMNLEELSKNISDFETLYEREVLVPVDISKLIPQLIHRPDPTYDLIESS